MNKHYLYVNKKLIGVNNITDIQVTQLYHICEQYLVYNTILNGYTIPSHHISGYRQYVSV